MYVPIGCGKCMECRRQKAQSWRVRLCEELKAQQYSYFITLTYNDESLQKLCENFNTTDANTIAAKSVRLFLERWRKKYGKSLRHWLITELGQEHDRLHLHGIFFTGKPLNNETLQSIWQYGYSDTGEYCNIRTINYIIKYVTKLDTTHKQYTPLIMCSPGLGK